MTRDMQHHYAMQDAIDRHMKSLFHGLPRTISCRSAVVRREREQNAIEDALDGIERAIFRARTKCHAN